MAETLSRAPSAVGPAMKREKVKEVVMRHRDLQQNQNKAQAALLSVLFMTQITELKMLLDIGHTGHRFYGVVLALLITSICLQIVLGIIIIYIGHLRDKSGGWVQRLVQCMLCKCRLRCCCKKSQSKRKRASSYISVPIGVGAPERNITDTLASMAANAEDTDDEVSGCCVWPSKTSEDYLDEDLTGAGIESANIKLQDAMGRIIQYTNEIEKLEESLKRLPNDRNLSDDLRQAKDDLHQAKKDKEEAEIEHRVCDSRRQQALLATDIREEREERKVFRKLTRWQQTALYLLYFIGLMNVFVTAFGISGSSLIKKNDDDEDYNYDYNANT